jgi:RNA-directed DNA polymerase
MQLDLFEQLAVDSNADMELYELFDAYVECRRNKRNTANALAFEMDYENKLIELWQDINAHTYSPGKSIAFVVDKPVLREIFAADFRDRVVHHWLIRKLNPLFEKLFIVDSYACRVGKGTHFGVQRIDRFIRRCSQNYTQDCYILKLDIQGFFMAINKDILWTQLQTFIHAQYHQADKHLVLELCRKIIDNDPTQHCLLKGKTSDWLDLPATKSLFHSPVRCGLPIGNLTSKVFANFYLNAFDHYVKKNLGIRYYGRYVDDFVLVHPDQAFLKAIQPKLAHFLLSNSQLTLHPKKNYLQHYSKGVQFLGTIIKPHRIYIANRTKGNFYAAIQKQNRVVQTTKPGKTERDSFLSCLNSALLKFQVTTILLPEGSVLNG